MLVAPLNWGLGHATRCVPIINALIEANFEPIIASDGDSLTALKKQFPSLKSYQLPAYNINYSEGKWLYLKLISQVPRLFFVLKKEQKVIAQIIEKEKISGLISDNRFGVFNSNIPSVYITHQITVLSSFTTFLTSKIHQKALKKYTECWVPDTNSINNLSGKLSKFNNTDLKIKFVGIVSRFKHKTLPIKYDAIIVLSGPEPQRSLLEQKLIHEFLNFTGSILMVRGLINENKKLELPTNFKVVNYMETSELQEAILQSELVIARSGYSTLMDLAILGKKAFFIPTPGQTEQLYLANRMEKLGIAPTCLQHEFTSDKLNEITNFSGFSKSEMTLNSKVFNLFNGE